MSRRPSRPPHSLLTSTPAEQETGMVIGGGAIILIAAMLIAIMLSKRDKK